MVGSGHVAPHSDLDIVHSIWPRQKDVVASSSLRSKKKLAMPVRLLTDSFCAKVLIYQ